MSIYAGIHGIARTVPHGSCQVQGITRDCISGYAGIRSVARKIFDLTYSNNLSPGIYDSKNQLLVSYEESKLDVTKGKGDISYANDSTSAYNILKKYPTATKIVIPDDPNILIVADNCFTDCSTIKHVAIPERIQYLGRNAFRRCTSLESIIVPDAVQSIGDGLFRNCSNLKSIKWSASVKYIPQYTFYECTSLVDIKLGESTQMIDSHAFHNCTALTDLDIPYNVTYISLNALTNVKHVTYHRYLWGAPWGALSSDKIN